MVHTRKVKICIYGCKYLIIHSHDVSLRAGRGSPCTCWNAFPGFVARDAKIGINLIHCRSARSHTHEPCISPLQFEGTLELIFRLEHSLQLQAFLRKKSVWWTRPPIYPKWVGVSTGWYIEHYLFFPIWNVCVSLVHVVTFMVLSSPGERLPEPTHA